MSRISELAVSKRSVALLLAAALFVAGIGAWGSLKQELLPDIQFPVITVIAPYPGVGAADVAEQVSKPIERAVANVTGLKSLQSASANSISIVVAQFAFGSDVKATLATIEQNVQGAGLPASVTPKVSALNINAAPVIIASISASGDAGLTTAGTIARTRIVPDLLGLDGVASVDLAGGLQDKIVVTLDPKKMATAGVSFGQVTNALQANNLTLPSGQISANGTNIPVSTIGSLTSIDQVQNLVVAVKWPASTGAGSGAAAGAGAAPASSAPPAASAPGQPTPGASPAPAPSPTPSAGIPAVLPPKILLRDIATVAPASTNASGFARYDGNAAITITVSKGSNANTVTVADEVTAKLAEIQKDNPGIAVAVVSDLSGFIKESRDGLLREGGLGALFAVLTIFLFLFSLRSTLVAAVSIPLSVLTALVVMQVTGTTLNVMTLGGLAVAVGRVVDDAIVVLENIYRHRALGDDRLTAVLAGPREVAGAITSATLTTVAVFLPLGFVGGIVSQLFLPFALTVTFALVASLVCALTVVPVLAYLLIGRVKLNVDEDGEPKNSFWIRVYTPSIRLALRSRKTKASILALSLALFVGSMAIAPFLPTQFINAGSEKILGVTVAPPAGTSSAAVLARAIKAEQILMKDPKVRHVTTSVPAEGDTGFGTLQAALSGRPANSATLTVRLADDVDLTTYAEKLSSDLGAVKTDGFDVAVAQTAGFTSNSLSVIVSSTSAANVATATDVIIAALKGNPNLLNLKTDLSKGTPEVQVVVDPNKAVYAGLNAASVGGEVRRALVGTDTISIQPDPAKDAVPVFVQLDPARVTNVDELRALPVGAPISVPLSLIASVDQANAQGSITRIDQSPAASIGAEIASVNTGAVSLDVQKTIDGLKADGRIPAGVTVELAGVTQQMNEAFGGLFFSMAIAILLVYVAMVLTFNSLITPFIILFTLPLATIGAFPALLLTGRPIGVSALIGFLMLIGIVVTNAIVLLDLVERLRARGMSTTEALVEGGRTRVRPILMTAIATILALIPLAAGLSKGSIIAAELGTVVIGGLFSSTFLTLLVIPIVYSLVDGVKVRFGRRFSLAEPTDAAAEAPAG